MKAAFLAASAAMLMAGSAQAATTIAGFTFTSTATSLIESSGIYTTQGGPLATVLTDSDAGTYAVSTDPAAFLRLGFASGILNGAGDDFVVFTLGSFAQFDADPVSVTVNGVQIKRSPVSTGTFSGGPAFANLNAAAFDLSEFGLGTGSSISEIRIGNRVAPPLISFVGVLNTAVVPEPSTWMLMIMGFGLIAQQLRRRHRGVAQVAA